MPGDCDESLGARMHGVMRTKTKSFQACNAARLEALMLSKRTEPRSSVRVARAPPDTSDPAATRRAHAALEDNYEMMRSYVEYLHTRGAR